MDESESVWRCSCGEVTSVSHWRHGSDGALFHAGADAPPSDPCLVPSAFTDRFRVR